MFRKRRILTFSVTFFLLCTIVGVCFAASGFRIPQLFVSSVDLDSTDAVFERNGEILYFNSDLETISILSAGGKYSPHLSPDNSKILYRKSVFDEQNYALVFGTMDLKGETLFEIVLDTEISNEILDLTWISESLVGITTHINPSSSEYFIYDTNKQEMLKRFVGNSFAPIPGTDLVMYEKNVPHWSDESVQHSFLIDDKTVYKSDDVDMKLCAPVFSADLTKVAFIEIPMDFSSSTIERNQTTRLVICDFDLSLLSLEKKNSIDIGNEISGLIAFNEDNEVCIANTNIVYWYNENIDSFVQEKVATNLRDNATDSNNYAKLQKSITTLYGDENLNRVHSINWIVR